MTDTQVTWKWVGWGWVRWLLGAFSGQRELESGTAKINCTPDLYKCLL